MRVHNVGGAPRAARRRIDAHPLRKLFGGQQRYGIQEARSPKLLILRWLSPREILAGARSAFPYRHCGGLGPGDARGNRVGGGNGTPLDYDELERRTRAGYEQG
jgi:hypothetical protein